MTPIIGRYCRYAAFGPEVGSDGGYHRPAHMPRVAGDLQRCVAKDRRDRAAYRPALESALGGSPQATALSVTLKAAKPLLLPSAQPADPTAGCPRCTCTAVDKTGQRPAHCVASCATYSVSGSKLRSACKPGAEHRGQGFSIAVYNRSTDKVDSFMAREGGVRQARRHEVSGHVFGAPRRKSSSPRWSVRAASS